LGARKIRGGKEGLGKLVTNHVSRSGLKMTDEEREGRGGDTQRCSKQNTSSLGVSGEKKKKNTFMGEKSTGESKFTTQSQT